MGKGKKRGRQHLKPKRVDPVEAYFASVTRKQLISTVIAQDALLGVRNVILKELDEHLSDEQRERLAQAPYPQLAEPAPVTEAVSEQCDECRELGPEYLCPSCPSYEATVAAS